MNHPLKGVKVIELGQIIAGTYGGQVLSDLGAEVIKVETPNGDLGRIPSVAPINGAPLTSIILMAWIASLTVFKSLISNL